MIYTCTPMTSGSPISFTVAFRWVLLAYFLIRLVGISNPPLETGHSWRQSFTLMVSRNLSEESVNLLYPRTDAYGEGSDIIASEFPFFNFLIHMTNQAFGYAHWYGRLINLLVSSLGIYCFFLIVKSLWGDKVAFGSGVILISSIWFAFSRKVMPDTFSVSLAIMAIYLLLMYRDKKTAGSWLGFVILGGLAGLCKIPALIVLAPAGLVLFDSSLSARTKLNLLAAFILALAPVLFWYFYWEPQLFQISGNKLFTTYTLGQGWEWQKELWPQTLEKFYFSAFHSFLAFAAFLAGLVLLFRFSSKLIAAIAGSSALILVVFMLKTGNIFPTHNYYIIPFVPIMALVAGFGLSKIKRQWMFHAALLLIAIEGIANQQHDFFIKPGEEFYLELEDVADRFSEPGDKIIIWGGQNPKALYFAHREGWSLEPEEYQEDYLANLRQKNAVLLFEPVQTKVERNYPLLYQHEDYRVYRLNP